MKITTVVLIIIVMTMVTIAARAESIQLRTQTGGEVGLSLSSYKYQEPGYMSLAGIKLGLDIHATEVLPSQYFIRGDLRYAFGTVDYDSNGTGSAIGEPDWYGEARLLVGKDWHMKYAVVSPYAGLGYRYLSNDGRGISSTGAAGYRRESNYVYLPIGIIHRTTLYGPAKLVSTLEYDHLLAGRQVSRLSDTGFFNDVTNSQGNGYGLKLSFIFVDDNWAIGPYAHYWDIDQSNTVLVYYSDGTLYGTGAEPKNNTVEFGLKASQQF